MREGGREGGRKEGTQLLARARARTVGRGAGDEQHCLELHVALSLEVGVRQGLRVLVLRGGGGG